MNEHDIIRQKVLVRAATDGAFRQGLIKDPKAALTQALGASAASLRIQFVDNKDLDAVYVLPEFVGERNLTPEELEAVAGGWCVITCNQGSCIKTSATL